MIKSEIVKGLRDILTEATEVTDSVCYVTSEDAELFMAAIKELEKTPEKGHWIKTGQSFYKPNSFRNFCCSECMWELDEHIRKAPNFCPNCGADMREVEK